MFNPLRSLLDKNKKGSAAKKPCCCAKCFFYDDMGSLAKQLFEDDFPTSNSLTTSVHHTVRGIRFGVESDVECLPDGSISASLKPEIIPVSFLNASGLVKGMNKAKIGSLSVGFSEIPKLPGLQGEVSFSSTMDRFHVKTQYRHPYFSVTSDNTVKQNQDLAFNLSAVGRPKAIGVAAGIIAKVEAKKSDSKGSLLKRYNFGLNGLEGRVCFARGPWNMFLECTNFGRDYSFAVMRKVIVPYLTNEMLVAARLNAHAMIPDMTGAESAKDKCVAVRNAIRPVATFAARTNVTRTAAVKVKVSTNGTVGISLSERLSEWAHAVFAINVDGKNLSAVGQNTLNFALTIAN